MGSGDLNMKKSWHPVLLSNQQRVWEVEKKAHEEKKKLDQLRKELEEERQLAELQRLQEESTGKKRVEKMDWMYATPSAGGENGALGGAKIDEKAMEDYLLGKRRVDDVLKSGDKSIGASAKDFIAVQNANSAMDIAAKIREDPLLAIKRQEQLAYQAMMNNPTLRKKMKELKQKKEETKEERKERKKKEKEEKKATKRESRHSHRSSHQHYSDEEEEEYRRRRSARYEGDEDERPSRSHRESGNNSRRHFDDETRPRTRSRSPSRSPPARFDERRRDDRGYGNRNVYDERDRGYSRAGGSVYDEGDRERNRDRPSRSDGHFDRDRRPSPTRSTGRGRDQNDRLAQPQRRHEEQIKRTVHQGIVNINVDHSRRNGRPSALELDEKPTSLPGSAPPPPPPPPPPSGPSRDEIRAQRLAQMAADADQHSTERSTQLEKRKREEEEQLKREEEHRKKMGRGDTKGSYVRDQEKMAYGSLGLGEMLGRRGGKGLIKEEY